MNRKWTREEIAIGYEAMAELNLTLSREFAALEDEVQAVVEEQLIVK